MKVLLWIWRIIFPIIGIAAIAYWGGKMLDEINGGMSVTTTIYLGVACAVVGLIIGFTGWAEEVPPRWFCTMSEVDLLDNRIGNALQYAGPTSSLLLAALFVVWNVLVWFIKPLRTIFNYKESLWNVIFIVWLIVDAIQMS